MPQLSLDFLAFSAVGVLLYQQLAHRWRAPGLAALNTAFLLWFDPAAWLVLTAATLGVHLALRGGGGRVGALIFVLVGGFLALRLGARQGWWGVPIGVGFALLRLLHVAFDRASLGSWSALSLYNFVLFFPAVTVGPVGRLEQHLRDERRNRWDDAEIALGLRRIVEGYAKAVVLGGWLVAEVFGAWTETRGAVAGAACDLLYLYTAFAGYSDIAIGLGLLLGHRLPENFDRPFLASELGEFWRRWHASASGWCRDYIFTPLLARTRSPNLALVGTMVGFGLWHDLSVAYLAWGLYHGSGLVIWRSWRARWGAGAPGVAPSPVRRLAGLVATWAFLLGGAVLTGAVGAPR